MSRPQGPYTPIVRAGEWLIVSGQVGVTESGELAPGLEAQTRQAIANIASLLAAEGASLGDVVKTTCFLAHIGDFARFNEAYTEAFGDHRPARTTVGVAGLPLGAVVEVEAWARVRA